MQTESHSRARPKAHIAHIHTRSPLLNPPLSPFITREPDILYGNLQRDRGLRAILEAIVGTILLFKLQPRLGLLFSLVIPSVATITVRCKQRRVSRNALNSKHVPRSVPKCKLSLSLVPLPPYHRNRLNSVGASPRQS